MTVISYAREGGDVRICITGHADYGRPDIVCSAASALACTLMEALRRDSAECDYAASAGDVAVHVRDATARTEAVIDTIMTGYEMLSEAYPDNLRVVKEGEK